MLLHNREWLDVSVELEEGVVTWPGDPAFRRELLATHEEHGVEVSAVRMTVHTGTHIDAPAHYIDTGARMDEMPLDATIGPCIVVEIPDDVRRIEIAHFEALQIKEGQRVLFRTANSSRRLLHARSFVDDYTYLSPEAAGYLARSHVRCVGVDYLSVGGLGDDGEKTHRILLGSGIWVIEGLDLEHVPGGPYELVCLPLRIVSSEGAPARAILQRLDDRPDDEIKFIDDAMEWATRSG